MRRRAKSDANQTAIVKALRQIGASVAITSRLGEGFPDLAVGRAGRTLLLEVKDGTRKPSERKLTPDEQRFKDSWTGHYAVVGSIEQAIYEVLRNS